MLATRSGPILAGYSAGSTGKGYSLGGIHWRATLGYQQDTWRDPLVGCSGGILGGIHWRAALAGYSAGSTGELLWRDTWRDPLASCSGGVLGGGRGVEALQARIPT